MNFQTNPNSPKVLVLGSGTRSFLSVIRSLGRKGLEVHAEARNSNSPAMRSRYIAHRHSLPLDSDGRSWAEAVFELLSERAFQLVIPTNDTAIIPLLQHRLRFEARSKLAIFPDHVRDYAYDKVKMNNLARDLGIHLPTERIIERENEIQSAAEAIGLPAIIKPHSSYVPSNIAYRREVRKAFHHDDIERQVATLLDDGPVQIQQNFTGVGVGVEFLAHEGEILFAFQHRRIHEALHGGSATYRKSEGLNHELLSAARSIVKALNYSGAAMMEFKVNPATQEWIFIELNCRLWGSLPLAVASGADFPWFVYRYYTEGKTDFNQTYKRGLYCRDVSKDIRWFVNNFRADRSNPFLHTVPLRKLSAEPLNMLLLRERFDTLSVDDPKPGLREFVGVLSHLSAAFKRGLSKRIRRTRLRFIEKRRTEKSLKKARRILFVCKGNICRSPFAEKFLKNYPNFEVRSAGYFPKPGRPCPDAAKAVSTGWAVDLGTHRSVVLNQELVDWAEAIVVFDEANHRRVCEDFPAARKRLHRLAILCEELITEIADPYGGDPDKFRTTYELISNGLAAPCWSISEKNDVSNAPTKS